MKFYIENEEFNIKNLTLIHCETTDIKWMPGLFNCLPYRISRIWKDEQQGRYFLTIQSSDSMEVDAEEINEYDAMYKCGLAGIGSIEMVKLFPQKRLTRREL